MLREKIVTTLWWSALCIAGAMLADYLVTVIILNDRGNYTPLITLAVATIVALPTSYALVSGKINLRRTRDDLAAARDAAVHADRTKTQFFANMSHELRTPLNAILGFSELLALDVFAPKREEYAHLIHNAGTHLLSLVNDLLDLSRIEAGKLELHIKPIDLAALIEECAETVAVRARAKELRLVRSVTAGLPLVNADRRALTQILLNLMTNAIKFSLPGGGSRYSPTLPRPATSLSASGTKASVSQRASRPMSSNVSARRVTIRRPKKALVSACRSCAAWRKHMAAA